MDDDAIRWNERYADRPAPTAAMPEALRDQVALVPHTGRALDVACGAGAQSVWLAERGLEVVALDVSPVAVDLVRTAATAAAVGARIGARIDARVVDLDAGLPADLGRFDVIVCQRYRQPSLYEALVDHLADDGVAAITVLSAVGLDAAPGPFHAPPGELRQAFDRPGVELVDHVEADGLASVVLRRRPVAPN